MAREAKKVRPGVEYMPLEVFERFADLVAAAEREACAKVCEEADIREFAMGDQPYPEWYAKLIRARREQ